MGRLTGSSRASSPTAYGRSARRSKIARLVGSPSAVHPLVALRASGTGTRVLLDRLLRDAAPTATRCADRMLGPQLEAAVAVALGLADAAVGLRAAAHSLELDFVPLMWEPFELALPEAALGAAADLLSALDPAPTMPGFDLADSGTTRRP